MKTADLLLGGAAVVLGAATFAMTLPFPKMAGGAPGPALFPQILAVLLGGFGIVVMAQARQGIVEEGENYGRAAIVKAGLVLLFIGIYVASITKLGFIITGSLLLTVLMLMLEVKPKVALPTAIILTILTALLFGKVLRVPLPPGLFSIQF